MAQNFGANEFTFSGDRTQITFFPETPGPGPIHPGQEGGKLEYHGVEGDRTFYGKDIDFVDSALGTLISAPLKIDSDTGGITMTLLLPRVTGAPHQHPVTLETLVLKSSTRGFINRPGADRTYSIVPLLGTAHQVFLPLEKQAGAEAPTG